MRTDLAQRLCDLNTRFYVDNARSFSDTRQNGWVGWDELCRILGAHWQNRLRGWGDECPRGLENDFEQSAVGKANESRSVVLSSVALRSNALPIKVLDVAAGNLRFEKYLMNMFIQYLYSFIAIDNCSQLLYEDIYNQAGEKLNIEQAFCETDVRVASDGAAKGPWAESLCENANVLRIDADVVGKLLAGECFLGDVGLVDLAVSFGFMHHIPTTVARNRFISELLDHVVPGGMVALSFWRFADEEALRKKAQRSTLEGCAQLAIDPAALDAGDYLLGWKQTTDSFRYCHSFTDEEIDEIAMSVSSKAYVVARYRADGKSARLNEYLILQRSH